MTLHELAFLLAMTSCTASSSTTDATSTSELTRRGVHIDQVELSLAQVWSPLGVHRAALVDYHGVARLGPAQLDGIVLTGWSYSGFDNDAEGINRVKIAVLGQQPDGTMAPAAAELLPTNVTNGGNSVIAADFNGDGLDDILLPAHNESPFLATPSTVYLSRPDGAFDARVLDDAVMAHHASLTTLNGKPAVLAMSFGPASPDRNPILYRFGGGSFLVSSMAPAGADGAAGMSVTGGDYLGDGGFQVVVGDLSWGLGVDYSPDNIMQQYVFRSDGETLSLPALSMPAPYFNDKPQYASYVSEWEPSKTHTSRLYTEDVNHDGLPDVIAGAEIWSSAFGLQKSMLQILVNRGNLTFEDQSDILNPEWNQNSAIDYSLRLADVDGSGIKTWFMAAGGRGSTAAEQLERNGNYILVNDGTGRLHVAVHDEFLKLARRVNRFVADRLDPERYLFAGDGKVPEFIAYRTAAGRVSFLAVVDVLEQLEGKFNVHAFALVNVPAAIDLATEYRENLTVTDRNGSRRIRTFAGNDVISSGHGGGSSVVDGGAGNDTVVYTGPRARYTITPTATGVMVRDDVGDEGTDDLRHIEFLQFADALVELPRQGG